MSGSDRDRTRIVAGRNAVLSALQGGQRVFEVRLDRGAKGTTRIAAIEEAARASGVAIAFVDRRELDRIAGRNHQGVVAVAAPIDEIRLKDVLARCAAENRPPCLILMRELLHEHNLGAILRTADAAGADAVILPSHGGAELGPEAVRVSTGASETVPVVRQSLTQVIASLRREGVTIIGAEANAPLPYWEQDMSGPVAFILGGEDRALSQPLRNACDSLVRIPMVGHVTSLNVSVACALLLYERARQMAAARK